MMCLTCGAIRRKPWSSISIATRLHYCCLSIVDAVVFVISLLYCICPCFHPHTVDLVCAMPVSHTLNRTGRGRELDPLVAGDSVDSIWVFHVLCGALVLPANESGYTFLGELFHAMSEGTGCLCCCVLSSSDILLFSF